MPMKKALNATCDAPAETDATAIWRPCTDHPALRAACLAVARPALSRGLLASLLCSAALLTGSGAAFADACVAPYTVAASDACSNMVIGGVNIPGIGNAPGWANVENSGTISYNPNFSATAGDIGGVAAVSLFPRYQTDPDLDKTTTITNSNKIEGIDGRGIYVAAGAALSSLTNNEGASISGQQSAIELPGSIKNIDNSGQIRSEASTILVTNGQIETLQNNQTGDISGKTSAIENYNTISKINNQGSISASEKSAINNSGGGGIDEITNNGTITGGTDANTSGIINQNGGVITTLNNSQTRQIKGNASGVNNAARSEITNLNNSGTIQGDERGVVNAGTIGTFNNDATGSISGKFFGVSITGARNPVEAGTIDELNNAGTIKAENDMNAAGLSIEANAKLGALTNSNTISGTSTGAGLGYGVINLGAINTLTNSGSITGTVYGVYHSGTIGDLTNDGTIMADNTNQEAWGIRVFAGASLSDLTNNGLISGATVGDLNGYGFENEGTIRTLTNTKDITGSFAGLFNSGSLTTLNNRAGASIAGADYGVYHAGSIVTLTNNGTIKAENATREAWGLRINDTATLAELVNNHIISGKYTGGSDVAPHAYGVGNEGEVTILTNNGSIDGSFAGIYNARSGSIPTLDNKRGASITGGEYGVLDSGSIGTLTNDGTIEATGTTLDAWGLKVTDKKPLASLEKNLTHLVNNNIISGVSTGSKGYGVGNEATISTLTNNNEIIGSYAGLYNFATGDIPTLDNNAGASITGKVYGVYDSASIGALTNKGTIKAEAPGTPSDNTTGLQVAADGSITKLQNDGFITAVNTSKTAYGIVIKAQGNIDDLINTQTISATSTFANSVGLSLDADGNLGTLTNSGTISGLPTAVGKGYGVANAGTIGTLTNSKDITGSYAGLSNINTGSIPIFNNNAAATITGAIYGVYDSGSIRALTNAGTIKATAPGTPSETATGMQVAANGSIARLQNDGSITAVNTSRAAYGIAIEAGGSIGELTNTQTISGSATGGNGYGVANGGAINTLTNSKTIDGSTAGLSNTGSISTFNNNAGATITGGIYGVYHSGTIGALTNAGTIKATAPNAPTADATGLLLDTGAGITTFSNVGEISAANTTRNAFAIAIRTDRFDTFNNTRTLSATSTSGNATALFLDNAARIRTLTNESLLNGASTQGGVGIGLSNAGTITNLTNRNVITGSTFGITNTGTINTFTNYQGGDSTIPAQKALTYQGQLPGSYFIHITSSTYYGQLVFTNPTGSMSFGVTSTSAIEKRTYYSVLSNLDTTLITGNRSGNLKGLTWYLEQSVSSNVWDLVFKDPITPIDPIDPIDPVDPNTPTEPTTPKKPVAPSATSTIVALGANAANLRQALNARTAAMVGAMDYDCATFDAQGFCLSFQARYSATDSASEGAGVLTGAWRLSPDLRLGGFIDYSLARRDPQGLKSGDQRPMLGAFLAWDGGGSGLGLQGKLTGAMHTGRLAITRSAALEDAEAGSGKASLNSYGVAGEIGWGLALDDGTVMTPYVGLRHTLARRGAYGERAVEGVVDFPISYATFSQSLTTATAGLRLKGQVTDQIGFQFGLGAEYDLIQKAGAYTGASAIPGLETFALPGADTANRFRPVGNAGLFYQIDRTQRLTGSVTARGQAFSNQPAVTVLAGYQAAF